VRDLFPSLRGQSRLCRFMLRRVALLFA
jgi:hypothetical protein